MSLDIEAAIARMSCCSSSASLQFACRRRRSRRHRPIMTQCASCTDFRRRPRRPLQCEEGSMTMTRSWLKFKALKKKESERMPGAVR